MEIITKPAVTTKAITEIEIQKITKNQNTTIKINIIYIYILMYGIDFIFAIASK